jgi:hypothetical protein
MIGVKLSDSVMNKVIREGCGVKEDVVTKIEKNMLRWLGHVERIGERRLTKGVYETVLSSNAVRGRPRRTIFDQIGQVQEYSKKASVCEELKVKEARGVCKERSKWKEVISAYPNGKQA